MKRCWFVVIVVKLCITILILPDNLVSFLHENHLQGVQMMRVFLRKYHENMISVGNQAMT